MQDQNYFIWVFFGWNSKNLLYCNNLHQYPKIFPITKLRILRWNFKKIIPYLKPTFSNLLTCKVSSKNKKTLNLGPKFFFQYQMFNQHPRICEIIKFHPKRKKITLGPKTLYFGLWAGMLKIYCHICNQHPPICLIAKIRILQLGTKHALFA